MRLYICTRHTRVFTHVKRVTQVFRATVPLYLLACPDCLAEQVNGQGPQEIVRTIAITRAQYEACCVAESVTDDTYHAAYNAAKERQA